MSENTIFFVYLGDRTFRMYDHPIYLCESVYHRKITHTLSWYFAFFQRNFTFYMFFVVFNKMKSGVLFCQNSPELREPYGGYEGIMVKLQVIHFCWVFQRKVETIWPNLLLSKHSLFLKILEPFVLDSQGIISKYFRKFEDLSEFVEDKIM